MTLKGYLEGPIRSALLWLLNLIKFTSRGRIVQKNLSLYCKNKLSFVIVKKKFERCEANVKSSR